MTHFEMVDDAAMEQVKGGLSFSIGFDSDTGLSVDGPLGSLSLPSPLTIAKDLVTTVAGTISELLTKVGAKLTEVGQLFDFS